MLRSRKRVSLFILLMTLILIVSGLFLPVCLAQEAEEPPAEEPPVEEEKPIFETLREALDEYLLLMGEGEVEEAFAVLEEYLSSLKELDEDPAGLSEADAHAAHVLYVTSKHLAVLMRVYEKVPENARKGISNALVTSTKGHANAFKLSEKAEDEDGEVGDGEEMESAEEDGANGQGKGKDKEKKEKKEKKDKE